MIIDLFKKKDETLITASRELLDQALVQRSRMDLVFDESVTSLKGLSCSLNTLGSEKLYLDVYGIQKGTSFIGKYFSCYFRIREGKSGMGFFGFRAKVLDVRQAKNGGIIFVTSMPAKVERSQRRRSMRVRPELSWFDELLFWNGGKLINPGDDEILFGLRELKQGKLCRMENMSAGGIGLYFDREFCRQSEFCPAVKDEFTLYMRFAHEVRHQPRELWLVGRTVRLVEDPVSKDLQMGVEFEHVGRKDQDSGEMKWMAVQDNVAEELIERVFEWHSTLFRERSGMAE
jgi:c-di-GMP-binding flagellar brake protein YcgR